MTGDGPEFFTLLLGATLGMCLMASTTNLLMMLIAMEMASLPSYVLAGFRKTHPLGAEASLKYVLFGAASSSIMAYGLSLLYGLFGSLQLETIAAEMTRPDAIGSGGSALLAVAMAGLIIGIGFKIAAVPFHFWCPDVFEGAGIDVAAFLSVASKGAALLLLLRVVSTLSAGLGYHSVPGFFADNAFHRHRRARHRHGNCRQHRRIRPDQYQTPAGLQLDRTCRLHALCNFNDRARPGSRR